MTILARLKKLWVLSGLDSAHLEDLLGRAANDARTHREIPIRGDGSKKDYTEATFIPYEPVSPINKIVNETDHA